MDQAYVVRHKHFVEGIGIRRIAREMGLSRNTVRKYLDAEGVPAHAASRVRASPVITCWANGSFAWAVLYGTAKQRKKRSLQALKKDVHKRTEVKQSRQ